MKNTYNVFHSNWLDVIVHAVDGVSLQYFFIQGQFTEIDIIAWLIKKNYFSVIVCKHLHKT